MGEIVAALGLDAAAAEARVVELLDAGRGGARRGVLSFAGGAAAVSESNGEASLARAGDLVVAFHGFAGSWDESGWSAEVRRAGSDAERVALAIRELGEAAIERVRGEFALLAVDLGSKRVLAARDTFGLRPLHHARTDAARLVASDIRPLRVVLRPRPDPVAFERLRREEAAEEETPFQGLVRFRSGVTSFGLGSPLPPRAGKQWEIPEPITGDEPGEDEPPLDELLESLRAALLRAVRRCLPAGGRRLGIALSGGIDSSIVWAIALEELRRAGGPEPVGLTLRFPGTDTDEGAFVEAVLAHTGGAGHEIALPCPLPSSMLEEAAARTDSYHLPNLCLNLALARLARAHGIDIVLTGYGGDHWFTGGPGVLGELVLRGQVASAVHLGRELARRKYWSARRLVSEAVLSPVLRICRAERHRPPLARTWARAGAGYRIQLAETLRTERTDPISDLADQLGSGEGVEFRSPLMDRDLVEVAVRTRDARHIEGGQTKRLLRLAMRGRVPDRVLDRDDKAEFGLVLPGVACVDGKG